MTNVEGTMGRLGRGPVLIGLLLALAVTVPMRAQVALTTVADTVYSAKGTPAQGTVVVSWSAFRTASGAAIEAGTTSATLGSNGSLSIALAPNANATPTGSYYTAIFHLSDGTTNREYWVVPAGSGPVKLAAVESQVMPTSMAVQAVSKAYVDQAISAAVLHGVAPTTTASTSSPSAATSTGSGTTSSNATGSGTTSTGTTTTPAYVQKTGDSMTGPLVLPADPVSAFQAADKHYVDASVAAVGGGSATKVSTVPTAAQTVAQPNGTQLEVNSLNGVLDATGFVTAGSGAGIGNALASSICTNGCEVSASQTYSGSDQVPQGGLTMQTHLTDHRGGGLFEVFQDPLPVESTSASGRTMLQVTTRTAQQQFAAKPTTGANNVLMIMTHNAMNGGSNQFPNDVEQVPYSKSNYGILGMVGNYWTQGQHVQMGSEINCYAVGDCLAGGQFIRSSGGYRDEADEGAHPFDLQLTEDSRVFQGTCNSGCTTGATSLAVAITANAGTQGDGRFLMDKNPSKVISGGLITGTSSDYLPIVQFSGTSFPVSVQMRTAAAATSQASDLRPGTVSLPIMTSGLVSGYAVSTAALPATSGVACVADTGNFPNFETALYQVVDATHLRLTLNKVHASGAVVAVGGLCGYGLEQVADTQNPSSTPVRQIFPVVGSPSAGKLYYAPSLTPVAGLSSNPSTSGFLTVSANVVSAVRSGNLVTLNLDRNLNVDVNGLTLTVSGMSDASYNGNFAVGTSGPATLTYLAAGADGSSSGGAVSFNNGNFVLYPMAEVLSVYDASTAQVDGAFTLAANTVAWAAGDAVEEPHYFQQSTFADLEFITQYVPRPIGYAAAGKVYQGQLGPGARGWAVNNAVPANNYLGAGGTHDVPYSALLTAGAWQNSVEVDAGTQSVLRVHCNIHSCSRWDSGYALFSMDRNGGVQDFLNYQPQSSTASWILGGTAYSFSPTAFTAANIQSTSFTAGYHGNAQLAPGGSAGYSNFTLNGNNNDGSRLGFIGGGAGDQNLYLDVPPGGLFYFRSGEFAQWSHMGTNGLVTPGITTPQVASGIAANSDVAGTLQVAAGATSSTGYNFANAHGSAPVCMVQAQNATPAAVLALSGYVAQVTPAGLSVSVGSAPTAPVTFGYVCVGRD